MDIHIDTVNIHPQAEERDQGLQQIGEKEPSNRNSSDDSDIYEF